MLQHTATHSNALQDICAHTHTHTHTHTCTDSSFYIIQQTYDVVLHYRRRPTHKLFLTHTQTPRAYKHIHTDTHTQTRTYQHLRNKTHILANRCLFLPHHTRTNKNKKIHTHSSRTQTHKFTHAGAFSYLKTHTQTNKQKHTHTQFTYTKTHKYMHAGVFSYLPLPSVAAVLTIRCVLHCVAV